MPGTYGSALAKKLNLRNGTKVRILEQPADLDLGELSVTTSADAGGVLAFVRTLADMDRTGRPVVDAAKEDRIAWVAYPKAGQLGTDLNRDILWRHMLGQGVRAVRQIAIDEVWSAIRFRPQT